MAHRKKAVRSRTPRPGPSRSQKPRQNHPPPRVSWSVDQALVHGKRAMLAFLRNPRLAQLRAKHPLEVAATLRPHAEHIYNQWAGRNLHAQLAALRRPMLRRIRFLEQLASPFRSHDSFAEVLELLADARRYLRHGRLPEAHGAYNGAEEIMAELGPLVAKALDREASRQARLGQRGPMAEIVREAFALARERRRGSTLPTHLDVMKLLADWPDLQKPDPNRKTPYSTDEIEARLLRRGIVVWGLRPAEDKLGTFLAFHSAREKEATLKRITLARIKRIVSEERARFRTPRA